jgi:hypothetical protein
MRLIDADAYIAYCDEKWIPLNVDAVNEQPTIEAVPVRKGKWLRDYKSLGMVWNCSECGSLEFGYAEYLSKFCDNCGADMRGDSDE